jgi:hypothetical protein
MNVLRGVADSPLELAVAALLGSAVWVGLAYVVRTLLGSGYGTLVGLGAGVVAGYGVWRSRSG